jgi:hypothetical protein
VAGIVLDAGGLIAVEEGDWRAHSLLKRWLAAGFSLIVPAPVLAQVWRSDRNARLGAFLQSVVVEPLNEQDARRVGVLLGRARTADIADGACVVCAQRNHASILTTDMDDLGVLVAASRSRPGIQLLDFNLMRGRRSR